ncbi:MAG: hypothetical protein HGA49_06495 [Eubacteriaceae bacterium]|nr:hypothetical protein [Eubacteriaceae bacterium]
MKNSENVRIIVDSDSCPVKGEIRNLSQEYGVEAVFFASICHFSNNIHSDNTVYIDSGNQSVDNRIISILQPGDILVTNDYGLASIAIAKGNEALDFYGTHYHKDTIDLLLYQRYLSQKMRNEGMRSKPIRKRSKNADREFYNSLKKMLSQEMEQETQVIE